MLKKKIPINQLFDNTKSAAKKTKAIPKASNNQTDYFSEAIHELADLNKKLGKVIQHLEDLNKWTSGPKSKVQEVQV